MARLFGRRKLVPPPFPWDDVWQVPERFNFTRDVVELLASNPNRLAMKFVDSEGGIARRTFLDITGEASRWAALLRSRRLAPGDRVLVLAGKTPAWHAVVLGALKAGIVVVPCPATSATSDVEYRLEHSGARCAVVDRERVSAVETLSSLPKIVVIEDVASELRGFGGVQPTHDTAADDPAFILYTAGTTGPPKGATQSHAFTWAARVQAEHWLGARPSDLVWCTAETGSLESVWNVLLGPWSCGARTVIQAADFDVANRLELIRRLGVTVLCQTPAEFALMVEHAQREGDTDLGLVREVVSIGWLPTELQEEFRGAFGIGIREGYGQAESMVPIANLAGTDERPGSTGVPLPGHVISVVDPFGNPQPAGVEGDVALSGHPPPLFLGYWDPHEQATAALQGDMFLTGDRATLDDAGDLWLAGRFTGDAVASEHPAEPVDAAPAVPSTPTTLVATLNERFVGHQDVAPAEVVALVQRSTNGREREEVGVPAVNGDHPEADVQRAAAERADAEAKRLEKEQAEAARAAQAKAQAEERERKAQERATAEAARRAEAGARKQAEADAKRLQKEQAEAQRAAKAQARADQRVRKAQERAAAEEARRSAAEARGQAEADAKRLRKEQAEAARAAQAKAQVEERERKAQEMAAAEAARRAEADARKQAEADERERNAQEMAAAEAARRAEADARKQAEADERERKAQEMAAAEAARRAEADARKQAEADERERKAQEMAAAEAARRAEADARKQAEADERERKAQEMAAAEAARRAEADARKQAEADAKRLQKEQAEATRAAKAKAEADERERKAQEKAAAEEARLAARAAKEEQRLAEAAAREQERQRLAAEKQRLEEERAAAARAEQDGKQARRAAAAKGEDERRAASAPSAEVEADEDEDVGALHPELVARLQVYGRNADRARSGPPAE